MGVAKFSTGGKGVVDTQLLEIEAKSKPHSGKCTEVGTGLLPAPDGEIRMDLVLGVAGKARVVVVRDADISGQQQSILEAFPGGSHPHGEGQGIAFPNELILRNK